MQDAHDSARRSPGSGDSVSLRISDLSYSYRHAGRALPVLSDLDLTLRRGEFVSLVGPSGSGKSTLFHIVAGLIEPGRGDIWIDGDGPLPAPARRGRVGFMPQKDCLMPWRTVAGNAAVYLEVLGVPPAEAARRARSELRAFGLDGFADALPHELSGGMRQRVAFLRTMLGGRSILLLDEPFGALDAITRAAMQEWLLHTWSRLSASVLFVTHDVEEALLLSDRVYVMQPAGEGGWRLAEVGVRLPRPRRYDFVTQPEFVAQRQALLRLLPGFVGEAKA